MVHVFGMVARTEQPIVWVSVVTLPAARIG